MVKGKKEGSKILVLLQSTSQQKSENQVGKQAPGKLHNSITALALMYSKYAEGRSLSKFLSIYKFGFQDAFIFII